MAWNPWNPGGVGGGSGTGGGGGTTVIVQSVGARDDGFIVMVNAALRKIGADRILSLDQDSNSARIMRERYLSVLAAELHRNRWKFSIQRTSLPALSSSPVSDYANQYQLPIDYLRLIEGGDIADTADLSDYRGFPGSPLYSVEGLKILTNLRPPLLIRYIAMVTDTSLYNPSFKEAYSSRLAWEVCEAITQSDSKRQLAWGDYQNAIREAKRANAIEAPASSMADSAWVLARSQ